MAYHAYIKSPPKLNRVTPEKIRIAQDMRRWGHTPTEIGKRLGLGWDTLRPIIKDIKPE